MAEESITQLIDTIDRLVSEARTAADPKVRIRRLEDALARACEMMMRLNRRLKEFANRVLQEAGFGEGQADIPFNVFANRTEGLTHFQSKEALLDFLAACEPLLVGQLFLSKRRIQEVLSEVRNAYEMFMDQRVGAALMCKQFETLERFFCRPPYEGGGGTPIFDDNGPNGGLSSTRSETVCLYLSTFASIGSLIASVIALFASAGTGPTAQLQTPETRTVALLSLLLLSGFSAMLDEQEDIPAMAYTPFVDAPVGA